MKSKLPRRSNRKAPLMGRGFPKGCGPDFARSPTQRLLVAMLYKSAMRKNGGEVAIVRLHSKLWGVERPFRLQQQYVGGVVSAANRKLRLHGMEIKLGKTRRTYRLYRL